MNLPVIILILLVTAFVGFLEAVGVGLITAVIALKLQITTLADWKNLGRSRLHKAVQHFKLNEKAKLISLAKSLSKNNLPKTLCFLVELEQDS